MPSWSLHRGKENSSPVKPKGCQGSSLQSQLECEGVSSNDVPCDRNRKLIKHMIDHKTPGYITDINWQHESSTLQHEYILVCVTSPDTGKLSWLRVERTMNEGGSGNDAERKRAGSVVTIARFRESLLHEDDKLIGDVQFEPSALYLFDVARFVDILDNEEPQYTLWYHNCWWFARQLFKSLVSEFTPEDELRERLKICKRREFRHYAVLMKPPSSLGLGFVVTIPAHHAVWPIVIVGAGAGFTVSRNALHKTEKRVHAQVKRYMQERLEHDSRL